MNQRYQIEIGCTISTILVSANSQKLTCAAQKAMSALGHKRTCAVREGMSALPLIATLIAHFDDLHRATLIFHEITGRIARLLRFTVAGSFVQINFGPPRVDVRFAPESGHVRCNW
jgi:hypothetical protein